MHLNEINLFKTSNFMPPLYKIDLAIVIIIITIKSKKMIKVQLIYEFFLHLEFKCEEKPLYWTSLHPFWGEVIFGLESRDSDVWKPTWRPPTSQAPSQN